MTRYVEIVRRVPAPEFPEIDLPEENGIPLESNWHRMNINLLITSLRRLWRNRKDFFAGGNMFIYFSLRQAETQEYRGPDFFVVLGVDGARDRKSWKVWEEEGRYPDVIVELLSPTTAAEDLGPKKALYEHTFRTANYFCYDPDSRRLQGWRLTDDGYEALNPEARGWLWSGALQLWLGAWEGEYDGVTATWLRFHDAEGNLVPTGEEDEYRRAEAAEAETDRLREELRRLQAKE